ncbi:MAG: hypothetical protein GTO67_13140 [Gammaproteobacteria bacterium]|nr:hypothetical protein [Gammaproteobacteria bacterium]NIM74214.1 hypothetical protein [Gammaproteobacteria bacterium]NIN39513.1 hypothetical protein [Gammaproteobacteria bacterium]NIO25986.1 hypothetical protein [Gammaproteobacteria bacterium]NIO66619.1 hypothetical protein [Gammaproteobacteria bacterium]
MRIVSGGQTGADRAALDVALELGLESGGWVPLGREAEDGAIPERYPNLREADSARPAVRTELNVRDSDATVIISRGPPVGGTALTKSLAERCGKPLLHLDLDSLSEQEAVLRLREWLECTRPASLNVAGARESEDPGIHALTKRVLGAALGKR